SSAEEKRPSASVDSNHSSPSGDKVNDRSELERGSKETVEDGECATIMKRAEQAIEQHKWREAEDMAKRLEIAGFPDQAYYLRGKAIFAKLQGDPAPDVDDVYKAIDNLRHVRDNSPVSIPAKLLQAEGE